MLEEYQIKQILRDTFNQSKEKHGGDGWAKEDIEEAIYDAGGSKDDFYTAMDMALEICTDHEKFVEYKEMIENLRA